MGSPSDRRPGRPRDARVDAAIIEAANECLAEQGFAGTTVEAIAARAGVGKAAIYRRWSSREELLMAAARQSAPEIHTPDTGSLRDDLVQVFTDLADQLATGAGPTALLPDLIAEAQRNDELRCYFQQLVEHRRGVCAAVVYRAKKRGELKRGVDADLVVDMISGPLFYKRLIFFDPAGPRYVRNLVDAVLGGVQG